MLLIFGWACLCPAAERRGTGEYEVNTTVIPRLQGPASPGTDLDQPPWTHAARLTGLIATGGQALSGEPTWVYLFYDESALWMACRCEGRSGSQLKADVKQRDGRVWADDSMEFLFSPRCSRREFFQIIVNSTGTVYDSSARKESWNANLGVAAGADDTGWTAVVRVPFTELGLNAPRPGDVWTANFARNSTKPERSTWSAVFESCLESERFGRILFGGETTRPVRFRSVHPMGIGSNEIRMDPEPPVRFEVTGIGVGGRESVVHREEASREGACTFALVSDEVRNVVTTFRDAKGDLLAVRRLPMESPCVASRVVLMKQRFDEVVAGVPRFPSGVRDRAAKLVEECKPRITEASAVVTDSSQHTAKNWQRISQLLPDLERKLNLPWAYVRTLARVPESAFAVGLASPMQKVMIRDFPFPGSPDDACRMSLAKNEHEGVQVVVTPFGRDLRNAEVSVSPLRSTKGGGEFAGGSTTVSLVGHVKTSGNTPYEAGYVGWWPDPLLDFQKKCEIRDGENVAFWIDVRADASTPAGDYEATVTVRADECAPVTLRLNVHVWDFTLARGSHLPTAFTYDEHQVRKVCGSKLASRQAGKYHDLILDHRLNIDHIYRAAPPDLEVVKYGVAKGMNAFNLVNLGHGGNRDRIKAALDEYVPKLKAAGLLGMAYVYGFDEVKGERFADLRASFSEIHQQYPGLRTMTTAQDESFGRDTNLRDVVDIWVPLTPSYDMDEALKLRAEGKDMWWYICVVPRPPYANWFIESQAIEARLLMGSMSYKYKTGGVLYYLITLWTGNRKPIASGPYTEWNPGSFVNEKNGKTANGDGSLICAGPAGPLSTIRFENIRDGLEDYEYLWLLAEKIEAVRKLPATPDRTAFLKRAESLIAVPQSVVKDLTDYTRDPNTLYAFRTAVAEAIEQGGAQSRRDK